MSDTKKLNIDGGAVEQQDETQKAMYKRIPEADLDYKSSKTSLHKSVKPNEDGESPDDQLLKKEEEARIVGKKDKDMIEAKFVAGDHQNGDAKIEIEPVKQTFTGLTKEELMKYADDPFWVRLRWAMFVLFWTLWVAMLVGAITIIITAPKCTPPAPKTWWEQGPLMESESGDIEHELTLDNLQSKLSSLEQLEVRGVFVDGNQEGDSYRVITHPDEEKTKNWKELFTEAKTRGIRVIVDLTANFVKNSSDWFARSEAKEAPYTDYFVWRAYKDTDPAGKPVAPNNWVSTLNESAWTFSKVRNEFYLHQYGADQPDFNFRTVDVVKKFDDVIKYWLGVGVSGIRLSHAKHLLVDSNFTDERTASGPEAKRTFLDSHDFYTHARTSYQPELSDILAHWRALVKEGPNEDGVMMFRDFAPLLPATRANQTGALLVDLPRTKVLEFEQHSAADLLKDVISHHQNNQWPTIQYKENVNMYADMNMFSLLLPATTLLTLPQILQAESNATQSNSVYKKLMVARTQPSVLYGDIQSVVSPNNDTVAYVRLKSGNPGYLVLLNASPLSQLADVSKGIHVPEDLDVYLPSPYVDYQTNQTVTKVPSKAIPIGAKSVMVLTFVPKST